MQCGLKLSFDESYAEVFKKNADIAKFIDPSKNSQMRTVKGRLFAENKVTQIVSNSLSEDDAILAFGNLHKDKNVSFEDKIDFISIKETLKFMSAANVYLESKYITNHSGKGTQTPCKGWWSCWCNYWSRKPLNELKPVPVPGSGYRVR